MLHIHISFYPSQKWLQRKGAILKLLMQPWKSFYFTETAKPSWRFGLINHEAGIRVSTNKENCAKECRREHCELVANGFNFCHGDILPILLLQSIF